MSYVTVDTGNHVSLLDLFWQKGVGELISLKIIMWQGVEVSFIDRETVSTRKPHCINGDSADT